MEFIPKGLNSLKIQANFKLEFFLDFIVHNPFGIWTLSKKESCPFSIYLPLCQVWKFLDKKNSRFYIFKLELVEILEMEYSGLVLGLAQFYSNGPSPGLELARGPLTHVTNVRHSRTSGRPRRPPPPTVWPRPRFTLSRPRARPTASSHPITLIPSPLWPIDEAKSLSSSFSCSAPSLAPTLLAATTTGDPW
jgi:hypothetical protein